MATGSEFEESAREYVEELRALCAEAGLDLDALMMEELGTEFERRYVADLLAKEPAR